MEELCSAKSVREVIFKNQVGLLASGPATKKREQQPEKNEWTEPSRAKEIEIEPAKEFVSSDQARGGEPAQN